MKTIYRLIGIILVIWLTGCANPNDYAGNPGLQGHAIGFFLGFWHGLIAPFTLLASIFMSGFGVYEVHNTGISYNFGFVFGLLFWGGSSTQVIYRYTNNPNLEGFEKKV